MGDVLLKELAHDERQRRNISLRIPFDDGYRGIGEDPRVGKRLEESGARLVQSRS